MGRRPEHPLAVPADRFLGKDREGEKTIKELRALVPGRRKVGERIKAFASRRYGAITGACVFLGMGSALGYDFGGDALRAASVGLGILAGVVAMGTYFLVSAGRRLVGEPQRCRECRNVLYPQPVCSFCREDALRVRIRGLEAALIAEAQAWEVEARHPPDIKYARKECLRRSKELRALAGEVDEPKVSDFVCPCGDPSCDDQAHGQPALAGEVEGAD